MYVRYVGIYLEAVLKPVPFTIFLGPPVADHGAAHGPRARASLDGLALAPLGSGTGISTIDILR